MSKIATIPVFSSIVAILFFLNCQRWDYTDQDEVNQFNREMQSLMEFEFVLLDYERGIPVISKIKLNTNSINEIYSREFDSFIYQNNLAGLIKPTFFMSIF